MDDVSDELARVRRSQHGLAKNWNACLVEKEALQQRVYELEGALEECRFERNALGIFAIVVVSCALAAYKLLWES